MKKSNVFALLQAYYREQCWFTDDEMIESLIVQQKYINVDFSYNVGVGSFQNCKD